MQYLEIPRDADERTTLTAFLDWQRETLARKCAGLDETALKQHSAPPSNLTLLGLVRHMADVERSWFQRTIAGESVPLIYGGENGDEDSDFTALDSMPVEEVFATWRAECERSRAIAAAHDLDHLGVQRTGRKVSLRWVLTHMVEEYSRHNGHADLLRERIDGATGYD